MSNFIREVFSEKGIASSKRVLGAIIILVCLACIVYLVIKEGGTSIVKELLDTSMIIGGALLGISSVTGIWKKDSSDIKEESNNDDETPQED